MWTQDLFSAMRLARPGGTLATFTSAGFVRRGLQEAGFTMRKSKGFAASGDAGPARWRNAELSLRARPLFARSSSDAREVPSSAADLQCPALLVPLRRGWQVTSSRR